MKGGPILPQDTKWTFFIYNSRTTSRILTNFSGKKRSSIMKLVAKIRLPKVVVMEIVTHSLVFSMTDISARGQVIVLKFWLYVLLNERYNLYS